MYRVLSIPNVTEYARSISIYVVKEVLRQRHTNIVLSASTVFPGKYLYEEAARFLEDNFYMILNKEELFSIIQNDTTDTYASKMNTVNFKTDFTKAILNGILQILAYIKVSHSVKRKD